MNIFITGIAGFLGSNLAHKLVELGHNVFGNDNLAGGSLDNIPNKAVFYQHDCLNFSSMKKHLHNIDVLYHCAATAYEGLSSFSPHYVTNNVFQSSISVFSAAIANNVKKIIFCSSMARYGNQATPFLEESLPNPVDPYGIAKVAAENCLINLCNVHKVDWTILIPHNIIGPRQKFDDPYRNVASIFFNRILQNKPIIIYGDGEQKRCFSHVNDCLFTMIEALDNKATSREIFNIGPDEEFITIKNLADICSNMTGHNLDHIFVLDRPQEVKFATCSSEKSRRLLNYKTKYSLHDSLKDTYNYIKDKGPKAFEYDIDLEIINDLTPDTWKNKLI